MKIKDWKVWTAFLEPDGMKVSINRICIFLLVLAVVAFIVIKACGNDSIDWLGLGAFVLAVAAFKVGSTYMERKHLINKLFTPAGETDIA